MVLIFDCGIRVKVDESTVREYRLRKMKPFRPNAKQTLKSYYQVPVDINELPRSKLTGYQNIAVKFYPNGVTPERFNRGSRFGLAWIPDRSIRE